MPLLLAGDELGHTQRGNNNAYCQDNEIAWLDWNGRGPRDLALEEFVKTVMRLRRRHPAFRRDAFFRGQPVDASGRKDIAWVKPDGHEMRAEDWSPERRTIGFFLGAHPMLFVAMNAAPDDVGFALPDVARVTWSLVLDTAIEGGARRDVPGRRRAELPDGLALAGGVRGERAVSAATGARVAKSYVDALGTPRAASAETVARSRRCSTKARVPSRRRRSCCARARRSRSS